MIKVIEMNRYTY